MFPVLALLALAFSVNDATGAEGERHEIRVAVTTGGAPLPGVDVTLADASRTFTQRTDSHGVVVFHSVPGGKAEIVARLEGMRPWSKRLTIARSETLNAEMEVRGVAEAIVIACGGFPRPPEPFTFTVTRHSIQGQLLRR